MYIYTSLPGKFCRVLLPAGNSALAGQGKRVKFVHYTTRVGYKRRDPSSVSYEV